MKLYVPTGGTQPQFTGMTGTVTVNMNKKNTVKNFSNFIKGVYFHEKCNEKVKSGYNLRNDDFYS